MGDLTVFRIAELLEIDPARVFADRGLERAKREVDRRQWRRIIKHVAACMLLFALLIPAGNPNTDLGPGMAEMPIMLNGPMLLAFLILTSLILYPVGHLWFSLETGSKWKFRP